MKPTRFKDSSTAPIIAFDFDDTICTKNSYPDPKKGEIRPFVKAVMNFLVDCGVKVVIWTSRDVAINQDKFEVYDDLSPMVEWLKYHKIKYSGINKSVQFAPFHYNGRKIYAHMYIDDRAYGWQNEPTVMINVLINILVNVLGISTYIAIAISEKILLEQPVGEELAEYVRECVRQW